MWSSLNSSRNENTVDFSNAVKPMDLDKPELNLPVSETTYRRKEFVTNERKAR